MNKVRNIKFHLTWKGNGCVNYNGSNVTKNLWASGADIPHQEVNGKSKPCENVMFGKSNFTIDEDGKIIRTPKVSSNCIRHAIFKDVVKFNPQAYYTNEIMACFMASPSGFLRGHMLTPEGKSFTHASPLMVSDLTSIDGVYGLENFTSNSFDENGNRSSTSFFFKEVLGNVTYASEIVFDVAKAQFLCLDEKYGKNSLPAEVYESGLLEKAFEKKLGRKPYVDGVFTDSSDGFGEYYGEYGYRFDDEYINYLLNSLIEMLWKTEINKASSNLHLDKIEMYAETDPLSEEKEYVNLNRSDCGTYKFEYESFWNPATR